MGNDLVERLGSMSAIKVMDDYLHIHAMLDENDNWEAALEELTRRGWSRNFPSYNYWLAYTTQRLILGMQEFCHLGPKAAARILALEEALKPFAEEARAWVKMGDNYRPSAYCGAFSVGDLRRAARAYENKGEPT